MQFRFDKYRFRWLFLTLALTLLGAQLLQAGHHHGDHAVVADCLECQADNGQATIAGDGRPATVIKPTREPHPEIATAPVATFYRLAARGPPHLPV